MTMSNPFFDHPILNSPYECPLRHWELDPQGQPTQRVLENRRRAEFITPIPKPKKRRSSNGVAQEQIVFDEGKGISTAKQQYDATSVINEIRSHVDQWRELPNPNLWQVTPETARLLQHWRHHKFSGVRPFFCQVEAIETAIWLTEVAPGTAAGQRVLQLLSAANREANPELMRLALKLATGAGKTTVMAMLIAWQTINAVRRPNSKNFSRGFLVVAPGLTIKDRLRVLQPNDPNCYYASRELVPGDMLDDVNRAKIVITNFHAFKLRERIELSAGGRFAPPLRERKPDIMLLADHFLEKYSREHGKAIRRVSTPAIDMLTSYHWPGNVRELENTIERAVLVCDGGVIHGHHLPPTLQTAEASDTVTRQSLEESVEAFERDLLQDALKTSRGSCARAARMLGTTERIFNYKVKKYGLDVKRFKA